MARTKAFHEEAVLDKAVHLFWCKGYNATSMQDIVNTLQLSRSSLYETFGDKRALYLAALRQYQKKAAGAMIRMINETDDPKALIKSLYAQTIKESLADNLQKGCMMVNATVELSAADPDVAQIIRENDAAIEDAFYKAIKKGQKSGAVTTMHSARSLARFVFNTSVGLRVAAKSGKDKKALDDIVHLTLSVL